MSNKNTGILPESTLDVKPTAKKLGTSEYVDQSLKEYNWDFTWRKMNTKAELKKEKK